MPRSLVEVLENDAEPVSDVVRTFRRPRRGAARFEFPAQPAPGDLGGYISAFCFLRGALEAMAEEVALLRRRDEAHRRTITRFREQMRAAAAIQRDLLPACLPPIAGLDVCTVFRPVEALSGDLYDVFRIDDTHVGFFIADATGHGLPGGVLSTFISRSFRGNRLRNGSHRLLQPDEILSGLNRELLDVGFTDCPFVTALYAVYHEPTRTLTWARGGAPYPILARRREKPRQIVSHGPLVGAIEEANFEVVTLTLNPGDTVVFHTDGLENLASDRSDPHPCRDVSDTDWFQRLGQDPIQRQLQELEARLTALHEADWRADDITVVALQVRENQLRAG